MDHRETAKFDPKPCDHVLGETGYRDPIYSSDERPPISAWAHAFAHCPRCGEKLPEVMGVKVYGSEMTPLEVGVDFMTTVPGEL